MTVFAMTREMGTRGKDVAAALAERLGLEVVHHELVERHVAQRMSVNESAVHRFLEGDATLWDRWNIDQKRLYHFTAVELLELAEKGNVIIRGWGAAQVLRGISHVIGVRICAPLTERMHEMVRRLRIDDDSDISRDLDRSDTRAIRREVDRSDNAHDQAVRSQFNTNWRDASGNNIVLNTAFTPVEAATEILVAMAGMPAFQETEASRRALAEKLTLARVRAAIDESSQHTLGGRLELSITGGTVRLDGVATQDIDLSRTIDIIKGVEGVTAVENGIKRMPNVYTA